MKTRMILYADENMILTDGEVYGKTVYLAEGRELSEFHEITDAEYEQILKDEEEKNAKY